MTDHTSPLTAEREQEIRESIPTVYRAPWIVHEDMDNDVWRVMYATDNPLAGLVAEVPDYGGHLAEFIAEARSAVPELLAELDRQRALVAAATAIHEKGEHNGLAICLHCASQMFPPPETGIWSESAWPCATMRALGVTDDQSAAVAAVETGE